VSYLFDTCVVSEAAKTLIDPGLENWLAHTPPDLKYLSVLSLAEIEFGILRMAAGQRRSKLEQWLANQTKPFFGDRLLAFDAAAASQWARLRNSNPNVSYIDGQIAATALAHGLTLVTRNVRDFAFAGLPVFNPWSK
jgi:predicted nucleic acid-binding protein